MLSRGRTKVLHLVRHAESNWNDATRGEHVGAHPLIVDVDSRLSGLGLRQASALGQRAPLLAPPIELVLCSPLSRALHTALGLVGLQQRSATAAEAPPVQVEALLSEWLENSCDVGRPGSELEQEHCGAVRGLSTLGDSWWAALPGAPRGCGQAHTLSALVAGAREEEASVEQRVQQMLGAIGQRPEACIAVVSHCMILQKMEQAITGGREIPFLGNTEVRTIVLPNEDGSLEPHTGVS
jgi:broad specificity phosphatase PhoE